MSRKFRLSPSGLNRLGCHMRFWFTYVKELREPSGLSQERGNAIHSVYEKIVNHFEKDGDKENIALSDSFTTDGEELDIYSEGIIATILKDVDDLFNPPEKAPEKPASKYAPKKPAVPAPVPVLTSVREKKPPEISIRSEVQYKQDISLANGATIPINIKIDLIRYLDGLPIEVWDVKTRKDTNHIVKQHLITQDYQVMLYAFVVTLDEKDESREILVGQRNIIVGPDKSLIKVSNKVTIAEVRQFFYDEIYPLYLEGDRLFQIEDSTLVPTNTSECVRPQGKCYYLTANLCRVCFD